MVAGWPLVKQGCDECLLKHYPTGKFTRRVMTGTSKEAFILSMSVWIASRLHELVAMVFFFGGSLHPKSLLPLPPKKTNKPNNTHFTVFIYSPPPPQKKKKISRKPPLTHEPAGNTVSSFWNDCKISTSELAFWNIPREWPCEGQDTSVEAGLTLVARVSSSARIFWILLLKKSLKESTVSFTVSIAE